MIYTKKDLGSYNLHLIKTDKFKTITVKILFRSQIEKSEITLRNALTSLLVYSSKKYNTKRKLTIKTQELYSAGISVNNSRTGNYINTFFTLNVLNDKYTEDGNFKEALSLFSDIILDPDVSGGKFNESYVDIVTNRMRTNLSGIKEDTSYYSLIRALESFDRDSPVSYRVGGYLEDMHMINASSLYKYYQEMLRKDLIDIFVIGDFDEEQVVADIRDRFKLRILKKARMPYRLEEKNPRSRRLFAKETISNSQSKLNIICRYNNLTDYEIKYVLPIFNVIFGGGSDSKLFKIVREQHSLCYSIYSTYNKFDNILIIRTGIDKDNYNKCLDLVERIIIDIRRGKFDQDEIDVAREYIETSLDEVEETQGSIIDMYLGLDLLGDDPMDVKREKFRGVTRNEIIKVAKKVRMDTVFILEGEK